MSRPSRIVSLSLLAVSFGVTGCKTSTPYDAMYSPRKSHFVAPPERRNKAVEELLTADAPSGQAPGATTFPGGLPPADPSAIPGLPPATAPGIDPLATPATDPLAPPPTN